MPRIHNGNLEMADEEKILAGNNGEVSLYYDPVEGGYIVYDEVNETQLTRFTPSEVDFGDTPIEASEGPNKVVHAKDFGEVQAYVDEYTADDGRNGNIRITLPSGTTISPDPANLPVTLGTNVEIDGQSAKIDMSGIGKRLFEHDRTFTDSEDPIPRHYNSYLHDMRVQGDNTAGSQFAYIAQVPHAHFERIWIGGLDSGIELVDGAYFSHISHVWIKHCTGDGLVMREGEMGNKPNESRIHNISALKNNRGVVLEGVAGVTFDGNVEANDSWDLLADGVSGLDITGGIELGKGPDRDGDGTDEPIGIGISPDVSNHGTARGVSIHGTHFNVGEYGTAIVCGDAKGIEVSGCRFRTGGSTANAVEFHSYTRDLTFDQSNHYDSETIPITKHIDDRDTNLANPSDINNGIWSTAALGPFANIEYLANYAGAGSPPPVVHVAGGFSTSKSGGASINGADFPRGTKFIGIGDPTITATGGEDAVIRLSRDGQRAEGFTVDGSGSSGLGFGVYFPNGGGRIEDIHVAGAANDGVRMNGDNSEAISITADSSNVTGDDIQISGANCRVISSDVQLINDAVDDGSVMAGNVGHEANGHATQTGDGATTQFTIAHGLVAEPSHVNVEPATEAASTDFWRTADATNLYINYPSAPNDGATLEWYWEAEV